MSSPITCRYANQTGAAAACGAFDAEHHAAAAKAGLCCVDLAFHVDDDQAVTDVAPIGDTSPEWPPFDPRDEDMPGGEW